MNKIFLLYILFLIGSISCANEETSCKHTNTSFNCVKYVKNYDADTVTFNIPEVHPLLGNKINIRINGVDTPEIRTKNKCEKEKAIFSRDYIKNMLINAKSISLKNIERGKYFRLVADVIVDGISLKNIILKKGFGYSYDGGKKRKINWCSSFRDIASINKTID